MLCYVVLCRVVWVCIVVLYGLASCSFVLYCVVWCRSVLCCVVLLCCIKMVMRLCHDSRLHRIVLYCAVLYCIVLCCDVLHPVV